MVTVTKIETQALLAAFAVDLRQARCRVGERIYYRLGERGGAPVWLVQSEMGIATPGGALLTVRQAIQDLRPQAVILCGVAHGLHPDTQSLGDILIARQLHYYEPQQAGALLCGDRTTASENLLARFRSADLDWKGAALHFGLVLSGEKLVQGPTLRERLLQAEPQAIGSEAEGAGLYAAARDAHVDWILVKAIGDWGDDAPDPKHQESAAQSAAGLIIHMLDLGAWQPVPAIPLAYPSEENDLSRPDGPALLLIYNSAQLNEAHLLGGLLQAMGGQARCRVHDISGALSPQQAVQVREQIQTSSLVVALLSPESGYSEVLLFELELACKARPGAGQVKAQVIPIQMGAFQLQYPLSEYLKGSPGLSWQTGQDPQAVYLAIARALQGQPYHSAGAPETGPLIPAVDPARPAPAADPRVRGIPFERADGTMRADSYFYIEREGDRRIRDLITHWSRDGVTITLHAPRQVGKSSMLMRGVRAARERGIQVVVLDFQEIDQSDFADAGTFFRNFCAWLSDQLELEADPASSWRSNLGNAQQCTNFVRRQVLACVQAPVLLAMDEVDRILSSPVRSDFFRMLRAWHNKRAEGGNWDRLGLLMVISTEPYMLIPYGSESPFNVGDIITLEDFSLEQVNDLNQRYRCPFAEIQLLRLMNLLGGHPFLTRQAMYRVVSGDFSAEALLTRAGESGGPFGDHLKRYLFHLHDRPELCEALRQVILHRALPAADLVFQLKSAGLVIEQNQQILPRNSLYADYFIRYL